MSEIFLTQLNNYVNNIKLENLSGSYNVAEKTVNLLIQLVKEEAWCTAKDLLCMTKEYGKTIINDLPLQTSAANMILRLLKIIREEYITACHKEEELDRQESLHKILTSEKSIDDYSQPVSNLEESILDHINELQMELETSSENIAREATKHIHMNEIILTIGKSNIVEAFLKEASKKRKFEVIICECSPSNKGHEMALILSKRKIQTTIIPDSAMFGMMSRVNKVIIGTQAVMANGGLRAISGTHAVALAAKFYSVPVIVLAGMYKLSPKYVCSYDQEKFNQFVSPEAVLNYSTGLIASRVRVYNPVFDYVPPELVTLFISNIGSHAPSYIYRLLSELYHPDDNDLQ